MREGVQEHMRKSLHGKKKKKKKLERGRKQKFESVLRR